MDPDAVAAFRRALDCDLWFFKIGRMDPDKGWLEAVEAVHRLRSQGLNARLVIKPGAYEAFGDEVYRHMVWRGLERAEVVTEDRSVAGIATALGAAPEAAVLDLRFFVPDDILPVFYCAADGTLANSGYEPFGLVGLEAMAAGGVAYVGSTGEDYARPLQNCVVLDDAADPDEIVRFALQLKEDSVLNASIRAGARRGGRAVYLGSRDADLPDPNEPPGSRAGRGRRVAFAERQPAAPPPRSRPSNRRQPGYLYADSPAASSAYSGGADPARRGRGDDRGTTVRRRVEPVLLRESRALVLPAGHQAVA